VCPQINGRALSRSALGLLAPENNIIMLALKCLRLGVPTVDPEKYFDIVRNKPALVIRVIAASGTSEFLLDVSWWFLS
jgi:hypothetical protein